MMAERKGFAGPILVGLGAIAAVASLAFITADGRASGQAPSRPTAIRGARVFDGETIIAGATVLVDAGRIEAVGAKVTVPAGAEIVDGRGKTLLPGLIDAHVHTWSRDQLLQATAFGVTGVIDMFTYPETAKAFRKAVAENDREIPFFVSPQVLLTVAGGHGTQFGGPIPVIGPGTDIQRFVDERIAEGADFIKIIQDDGSAYGFRRPTLTRDQVAAIIRAAHARGKLAVIHAATLRNCLDALADGVDGLAHLYFNDADDPGFGKLAARKKAFVIPTLSVLHSMAGLSNAALCEDPDLKPFLSAQAVSELKNGMSFKTGAGAYAAAERALNELRQAGARILAGTDAGNPGTTFGASLHGELELLVQAGMKPIEALRAATSVSADAFRLEGRGRIRKGAFADLVLIDGDPMADIKATRRVLAVWREGKRLDREAYLETVQASRKAAEQAPPAPAPEYSESGLISDFEAEKISATFGAGWVVSTDTMMGGKSQARMEWARDGAAGSRGAMMISGEIAPGAPYLWAGALFSPGKTIMAPADLSAKKAIVFRAKGASRPCAVEVFAQSRGFMPAIKFFSPGPEWGDFSVTFEELQLDGKGVMGIFIGAVTEPGKFSLLVDDVRLK